MRIRLLYLIFKKHKLAYLLPVVIILAVVPLMIYLKVQAFGIAAVNPSGTTQMLVPMLSTWWIFLCFKEYVEGDGVELLYTYLPKRKSKLQDIFLLYLWYALHVIMLHVGLSYWFHGMVWECIRILIQCYFFIMFYYMLMYILKSTSISYMVVFVYYFMTMFFARHTIFELINVFTEEPAYLYLLTNTYVTFFLVATGFAFVGYIMNRNYHRLLKG